MKKKVLFFTMSAVVLTLVVALTVNAYDAWADCRRHAAGGGKPARNIATSGAGSFGLHYSTVSAYAKVDKKRHDIANGLHNYVSISVADGGAYSLSGAALGAVGGHDENTGEWQFYYSADAN